LVIGRKLGEGAGGDVYQASMTSGDYTLNVAVKQIKKDGQIQYVFVVFIWKMFFKKILFCRQADAELSEAEIMLNVPPHRNITMLYGVVKTYRNILMVDNNIVCEQ
jgi:hypothetical protein